MININKNITVSLYPGKIDAHDTILQEQCYTVQHFDYKCQRECNEIQVPYGPSTETVLTFTVRTEAQMNEFYAALQMNEMHIYTILINAGFSTGQIPGNSNAPNSNKTRKLSTQDAMLELQGYIVDVKEDFDTQTTDDGENKQMITTVKMLLATMTYNNNDKPRYLNISAID